MKTIRLVVYNETYWNKGLIYTQNILPLKHLAAQTGSQFEIISFTSILMYFRKRHEIKRGIRDLEKEGIKVHNFFMFVYPHKLFFPNRYTVPYLFLNSFIYIKLLSILDYYEDVIYNLRSYQTALFFYKFYPNKNRLIFDTRTDWIEENINAGNIIEGSSTHKYWLRNIENIINSFKTTLCISDVCRNNQKIMMPNVDLKKIKVVYNIIDYEHFEQEKQEHLGVNFLYTGSLGHWNKLENYLEVFAAYHRSNPNSKFIVCTNTMPHIVELALANEKYEDIKDSVEVKYNVAYEELPQIYALCDFGFQLMDKADSRVGVKYIEYVAAGVTPIVNSNVQGAAYIAKKYNLGIVLDPNISNDSIGLIVDNCKRINRTSKEFLAFKSLSDLKISIDHFALIFR